MNNSGDIIFLMHVSYFTMLQICKLISVTWNAFPRLVQNVFYDYDVNSLLPICDMQNSNQLD